MKLSKKIFEQKNVGEIDTFFAKVNSSLISNFREIKKDSYWTLLRGVVDFNNLNEK
jgi:hypothetical protein